GPNAEDLEALREFGLDMRVVSGRIGDASALKMCYAALNKGVIALMTEIGIAARRLGVGDRLIAECEQSQPALLERMRRQVPGMIPKAYRWVGEMQEIARTFEACGLTPLTYEGAAEVYRLVAETPLARVSPEEWAEHGQDFDRVVEALASTSFVSD
ncbi:MAG: DUF1932 domain-containing protein, partial [Geminicoccales bacterium]